MASLTILAILMAIGTSTFSAFRARAADGACTANMRSLRVSLEAYIQDNNGWPQMPDALMEKENEEPMWEWWVEELEPYGGNQKYWICPTHIELFTRGRKPEEIPDHWGSFVPTHFDDHPVTPYRWNQPWLMERGDFHGSGAKVLMPDGSIDRLPPKATGGRNR